jgi:hypothetical protein
MSVVYPGTANRKDALLDETADIITSKQNLVDRDECQKSEPCPNHDPIGHYLDERRS